MATPRGIRRRLFQLGLGAPSAAEAVDWEVEHYLAEQTDRLVAAGLAPEEARKEAERRFGDVRRWRRRLTRRDRRKSLEDRLAERLAVAGSVLAAAFRSIRRNPAFSAAVIVTPALGIGANTTLFGIIDRLLLRPPPHTVEPERVFRVLVGPSAGDDSAWPYLNLQEVERDLQGARAIEGIAALHGDQPQELSRDVGGDATRIRVRAVSASFFPLLGVQPVLGRSIAPEEDDSGVAVAVISHEYWERAFGADPGTLGRNLLLPLAAGQNLRPYEVVGVMPRGFTGVDLEPVDAWVSFRPNGGGRLIAGGNTWAGHRAIVRLKPGVRVAAAEAELTALRRAAYARLPGEFPVTVLRGDGVPVSMSPSEAARESFETIASRGYVRLEPLLAERGTHPSNEGRVARWLAGVSLFVLLIACANVANLFLGMGARRVRETGVRLALGISRRRLVLEAVAQSILLAAGGFAVAALIATWGSAALQRILFPQILFPGGPVNGRIMAYALVVSLLAGLAAALPPALQGTRLDLRLDLTAGAREGRRRGSGLQKALVALQAGLCAVLLTGAGLFVRSMGELRSLGTGSGFDTDRLLMAVPEIEDVPDAPFGMGGLRGPRFWEAARLAAEVPGVERAALSPRGEGAHVLRDPGAPADSLMEATRVLLMPGYLETVGVRLVAGRGFQESDGEETVLVTRALAETVWPGTSPLGRCIEYRRARIDNLPVDAPERQWQLCAVVVGVVADGAVFSGPVMSLLYTLAPARRRASPDLRFFTPMPTGVATPVGGAPFVYLRTRPGTNARTVSNDAAAFLRSIPYVRNATVQPLWDAWAPELRPWRLGATLFSVFGLLAVAVGSIGLYSVLAFEVATRQRELGIRAALGRRPAGCFVAFSSRALAWPASASPWAS